MADGWSEVEHRLAEGGVGQYEGRCTGKRGQNQDIPRRAACLVEGQFAPDGEEKHELGQDAAHEPVGLQSWCSLLHKDCKEHEVKDGAHDAKQGGDEHDLPDLVLTWPAQFCSVNIVGRDRDHGEIGQQVQQQDLERQHR